MATLKTNLCSARQEVKDLGEERYISTDFTRRRVLEKSIQYLEDMKSRSLVLQTPPHPPSGHTMAEEAKNTAKINV